MMTVVRGRVWKFGDNIDTDIIAPWTSLDLPWEERRRQVLHVRPEFAREVREGDIVVAGRDFGCGSSREQAPENLKLLGVSAVVAESFARIYFRNGIAIAHPSIPCLGVSEAFEDGDELQLDIETARVENLTRGRVLQGQRYAPLMLEIIRAGGLLEVLKQRKREASA